MNKAVVVETCQECIRTGTKVIGILMIIVAGLALFGGGLYELVHYAWPQIVTSAWHSYTHWAFSQGGLPGEVLCVLIGVGSGFTSCIAIKLSRQGERGASMLFYAATWALLAALLGTSYPADSVYTSEIVPVCVQLMNVEFNLGLVSAVILLVYTVVD